MKLAIEARPETVTDCSCSICLRCGVMWAYCSPTQVCVGASATDIFMWDDRSIEFHRCRTCGCVTHWASDDKSRDRRRVNARLMAPDVLAGANVRKLDSSFGGRQFDSDLLRDLPEGVDPCGEKGEFHTAVTAGPMFGREIPVRVGETVERDGFVFTDLIPG